MSRRLLIFSSIKSSFQCDGVSLELANGPHLQGIALLNIPYTHGGSNLWGEHLSQKRIRKNGPFRGAGKKFRSVDKELSTASFNSVDLSVAIQDIGDHRIEVIGLENCLHMGQVRTGLRASGRRLAQCSEVVITTKKTFPMQIDGEPWMQGPSTVSAVEDVRRLFGNYIKCGPFLIADQNYT